MGERAFKVHGAFGPSSRSSQQKVSSEKAGVLLLRGSAFAGSQRGRLNFTASQTGYGSDVERTSDASRAEDIKSTAPSTKNVVGRG
jgi:hypothetical protein